jgi:hypothetical protein
VKFIVEPEKGASRKIVDKIIQTSHFLKSRTKVPSDSKIVRITGHRSEFQLAQSVLTRRLHL